MEQRKDCKDVRFEKNKKDVHADFQKFVDEVLWCRTHLKIFPLSIPVFLKLPR
jgi:hypothetical protein